MKKSISLLCLFAFVALLTGCVSRTTSSGRQGTSEDGVEHHAKVSDKKIIWIWQDEFRSK